MRNCQCVSCTIGRAKKCVYQKNIKRTILNAQAASKKCASRFYFFKNTLYSTHVHHSTYHSYIYYVGYALSFHLYRASRLANSRSFWMRGFSSSLSGSLYPKGYVGMVKRVFTCCLCTLTVRGAFGSSN